MHRAKIANVVLYLAGDPPSGIYTHFSGGRQIYSGRRMVERVNPAGAMIAIVCMMGDSPFLTRLKDKISSRLSYPVGAELISAELASVPQAQSLEISFCSRYERMETRGEPYPIFTVSYTGSRSYGRGWSIDVHPVPRALKHTVKEALKDKFFLRIRQWLEKHADLDNRYGHDSLSVIFDERDETMLRLEEHHIPSG